MQIEKKFNLHNNKVIKLINNGCGYIGSVLSDKFRFIRTNMFLTEIKTHRNNRKFVLSIRMDGKLNNYRMTQMHFGEEELIQLRDCIDEMITYKNENKYTPIRKNDFEKIIGKKYAVIFKEADVKDAVSDTPFRYAANPKYIEGFCENFSTEKVVFYSEEYGFNVIQFSSIFQMLEIK